MIKINLVPPELIAKARQRQQAAQAAVFGGIVLVIVLLISLFHYARLMSLQSDLADREAEFKRLEAIVAKVEELEKTAGALKARLGVINDLLKGRPAYPVFMSDLARVVPSGVTLRSVTTTGGSTTPMKLNFAAESRSSQDIAAWVKNMEANGKFTNLELGPVSAAATGSLTFTMTGIYTPKL